VAVVAKGTSLRPRRPILPIPPLLTLERSLSWKQRRRTRVPVLRRLLQLPTQLRLQLPLPRLLPLLPAHQLLRLQLQFQAPPLPALQRRRLLFTSLSHICSSNIVLHCTYPPHCHPHHILLRRPRPLLIRHLIRRWRPQGLRGLNPSHHLPHRLGQAVRISTPYGPPSIQLPQLQLRGQNRLSVLRRVLSPLAFNFALAPHLP
jgi:hypothetical protein